MSSDSSNEPPILRAAGRAKSKAVVQLCSCTGCEACMAVCPSPRCIAGFGTDASNRGVYVIYKSCIGCGLCAKDCPWQTIRMVPAPSVRDHATSLESQEDRSHPVFADPGLLPPDVRSALRAGPPPPETPA